MKKKVYIGIVFLSVVIQISSSGLINIGAGESMIIPKNREEHLDILEDYPHFLEDTILNGEYMVIVNKDGKEPPDFEKNSFDYVITFDAHTQIIENARDDFIKKYNIDPIVPLPEPTKDKKTYMKWALKNIKSPNINQNVETKSLIPHEINGWLELRMVVPTDSTHRPSNPNDLAIMSLTGWDRFEGEFGVTCDCSVIYGYWNAQPTSQDNTSQILEDLESDCSGLKIADNYIIQGLIKYGDHNGRANTPGFYNVVAEDCTGPIEHEKSRISQHEITHNIGGMGDTWGWWEHDECIMNYWHLFWGTTKWCNSCHNLVMDNIWYP
jgi:hypothetical protein